MNTKLMSGTGLLIAAVLFVALNMVSNATLTSLRLDVTDSKLYTLSDGTVNILETLEEPIKLRLYFSAGQFAGIPPIVNYGVRVRDLLDEYEAKSGGMIELEVIDPEPFSEAEDHAVAHGMQRVAISNAGEFGYFGLVGSNSTDDEVVLPFFQPSQEQSLEYELTKLVYELANPQKRVIGLLSGLSIMGTPANPLAGQPPQPGWVAVGLMRDTYEVRTLSAGASSIDADIDTLVVIHPKDLASQTRYAIDQFVLKGGKAMVFIDPFAEEDMSRPGPEAQMMLPERGSNLPELLAAWGVRMLENKIVTDIDAAIRVNNPSPRGPRDVPYLPWLQFDTDNLNHDDFVTNELNSINLGTSGALAPVEDAQSQFVPLIFSGKNSQAMERDGVMFNRDPVGLLEAFQPAGETLVIAARVSGPAATAFPGGKPGQDGNEGGSPASEDADFVANSLIPINVIVVADTDILSDRFWVHVQNFLGISIPSPIADNGDFLMNALDNLGGNDDLISLRSRGESVRPFDKVEKLRKDAEAQFRDKEQELQTRLDETETQISQLQQQSPEANALLLSPQQRLAIEGFRDEQIKIRKELRAVQHELRRNIERLGGRLKLVNIGLIPIFIGLLALVLGFLRSSKPTTKV